MSPARSRHEEGERTDTWSLLVSERGKEEGARIASWAGQASRPTKAEGGEGEPGRCCALLGQARGGKGKGRAGLSGQKEGGGKVLSFFVFSIFLSFISKVIFKSILKSL